MDLVYPVYMLSEIKIFVCLFDNIEDKIVDIVDNTGGDDTVDMGIVDNTAVDVDIALLHDSVSVSVYDNTGDNCGPDEEPACSCQFPVLFCWCVYY